MNTKIGRIVRQDSYMQAKRLKSSMVFEQLCQYHGRKTQGVMVLVQLLQQIDSAFVIRPPFFDTPWLALLLNL